MVRKNGFMRISPAPWRANRLGLVGTMTRSLLLSFAAPDRLGANSTSALEGELRRETGFVNIFYAFL